MIARSERELSAKRKLQVSGVVNGQVVLFRQFRRFFERDLGAKFINDEVQLGEITERRLAIVQSDFLPALQDEETVSNLQKPESRHNDNCSCFNFIEQTIGSSSPLTGMNPRESY